MNNPPHPRSHALLFSLLGLLLITGCSSIPLQKTEAEVSIPFEGEEAMVKVVVSGITIDSHARLGVSALQIKDWPTAVAELQQAVAASPDSTQYEFALGVAAEAAGNYSLARTSYAKANSLKGGTGSFDAQAGLKRLDVREGR